MKVRNSVSRPTVISPDSTLVPPTQSTAPIAAKKESDIAEVLPTRIPTRRWLRSSALREAASNFMSS